MPRLKAAFGGLGFREPEVRGPATKEPRHLGDVVSSLVESAPDHPRTRHLRGCVHGSRSERFRV